jgi:hypothetical protein
LTKKEFGSKKTGFELLQKGTAQGSRHRAQGKNNKKELILSLCLAPYTLYLKPLFLATPFKSHLCKAVYEVVF